MHALHRSGRPAEALDAYHKAKAILADQYGTIPGADLQSALMAVLSQGEGTRVGPFLAGMCRPSSNVDQTRGEDASHGSLSATDEDILMMRR